MTNRIVTGRFYPAKDRMRAEADARENVGIVRRKHHPSLGLGYEVLYVPRSEPDEDKLRAFDEWYRNAPYRKEGD